jgi:hypothetical protein
MKKILPYLFFTLTLIACGETNKQQSGVISQTTVQTDNKPNQTPKKTQPKIQPEKEIELDILVGSYRCKKTKDAYVFYSDNTGQFFPSGETPCSEFTWKRYGENVTIKYEIFGEQKLKFNKKNKTLTEKSQSFGTLIFHEE